MASPIRKKTPEELLQEVQAQERAAARGHLKIFLGYASGVGKSFRMFDEARRRRERGQDIVVGAVQPEVSPEVQSVLAKLEVVPMKNSVQIDLDALIKRHPTVCLIDGLAYDNPPGGRNPCRWQDVQDLLDNGIKVIGSVNIQYITELQDQIDAITGRRMTESVPVKFIKSADEVELVDAPAEEPLGRSPQQLADAVRRSQQLSRLRELALVLTADVVYDQLVDYLWRHGIHHRPGTQERILICISPRTNVAEMLQTGLDIAERFHGEVMAAGVISPKLPQKDQTAILERLAVCKAGGATVETLQGENAVDTLVEFARSRGVTQLFVGHSQRTNLWAQIWGNPVERLIKKSEGMDVRIFPQRSAT